MKIKRSPTTRLLEGRGFGEEDKDISALIRVIINRFAVYYRARARERRGRLRVISCRDNNKGWNIRRWPF